ncbi:MAG TPA: FAD-binding oxidoreductase [Steroidobacteraceae bacterium]|nr:FAD-binding oxidoreductase [Steroidobacteraceae bacterium]
MTSSECDIVVIGAGMAGASVAAHLAQHASVQLLEMESRPGYHSTGRSAALFSEFYGNGDIRALTRASQAFFHSPPQSFCSTPLVKPRPVLIIARPGQLSALEQFCGSRKAADSIEMKSPDEALQLWPSLRPEYLAAAAFTQNSADIEVHELHQGYLRLFRARSGVLTTRTQVIGLQHDAGRWSVATPHGTVRAAIVVNAAGAWAEEIGGLAGAIDIGLLPLKRTACLIGQPPGQNADLWPMLLDVEESFYVKPDAGMLLLSPADETLTRPCDAQADELDIAVAVDRLERATTLDIKRVAHKWAGLRCFVKDRSPVVGYDPKRPGFFWVAALGGYGIQTAPALSRLAASLLLGSKVDEDLLAQGVAVASFAPDRLETARESPGGVPDIA